MSEFDDSEDKIRRNLVFISFLILSLSLLGVSEKSMLKKLLYNDFHFEMWEVLAFEFVLLTYFSIRFRFSDTLTKTLIDKRVEFDHLRLDLVMAYIKDVLKGYVSIGLDSPIFTPRLSSKLKKYRKNQGEDDGRKYELKDLSFNLIQATSEWTGEIKVKVELKEWSGVNQSISDHLQVTYGFFGAPKYQVLAKAYLRIYLYSKSSISLYVPILLAAFAYFSIAYRFWVLLGAS